MRPEAPMSAEAEADDLDRKFEVAGFANERALSTVAAASRLLVSPFGGVS